MTSTKRITNPSRWVHAPIAYNEKNVYFLLNMMVKKQISQSMTQNFIIESNDQDNKKAPQEKNIIKLTLFAPLYNNWLSTWNSPAECRMWFHFFDRSFRHIGNFSVTKIVAIKLGERHSQGHCKSWTTVICMMLQHNKIDWNRWLIDDIIRRNCSMFLLIIIGIHAYYDSHCDSIQPNQEFIHVFVRCMIHDSTLLFVSWSECDESSCVYVVLEVYFRKSQIFEIETGRSLVCSILCLLLTVSH